ncbi:MAG: DUF4173 domain-containing protein [Paracoccaceae bacterium]
MQELTIRGLPSSLARDGLWFADTTENPGEPGLPINEAGPRSAYAPLAILVVLLLIAMADMLFWKQPLGISLILFSAGLSAEALVNLQPQCSGREWAVLAGIWIAVVLPVVEYLQSLSILFLVVGHAGTLIWCATRSSAATLVRALLLFPIVLVVFAVTRSLDFIKELGRGNTMLTSGALAAWVLPLVVGSIFLMLFVAANPVFKQWLSDLSNPDLGPDALNRTIFWAIVGMLVLPFAFFKAFAPHLQIRNRLNIGPARLDGAIANARSVTNSLMLFNIMLLLQNISDVAIFWGGARLPEGMTYATYAHNGAYPLMATSILAGIFALVSRPFTDSSRFLRSLLLLWIVQNIILLTSALLRLELYVEAYGLTYLRIRAAIGMFLVLVGMILLIWQLSRAKSNLWLTSVFAAVIVAVKYVGSFVNFGYVIAAANLSNRVSVVI